MKAVAAKLPALPLACGVLTAILAFNGHSWIEFTLLGLSLVAAFWVIYYGVRFSIHYFLLGLCAGILSCCFNRVPQAPAELLDGNKADYKIEILKANEGAKGFRCLGEILEVNGIPFQPFRVYLNVTDNAKIFSEGMYVRLRAGADDVFYTSKIPFMEMEALAARSDGVTAKMHARSDEIEILPDYEDGRLSWFAELRDRISLAIHTSGLSPEVASLLSSVCLGTGEMTPTIREKFRVGGIAHLLCISGFHVAMVAGLAVILLWPFRLWRRFGRVRYVLMMIVVWLYVALIGFTPSAVRAAIMLCAYYTGRLLQRGSFGINSLLLAFALILVYNPCWLYSVGLQLSVSAVAGILIFARKLNPVPMRDHSVYRMCEFFTVPLSAMIGTAPVIICWFHRLSLLSVLTNAFASLLFVPFVIMGILTVIISALSFHVGFLCDCLDWIYNILVRICGYSTGTSQLTGIYIADYKIWLLVLCIVLLAVLIHCSSAKARVSSCVGIVLMLFGTACDNRTYAENEFIVAGNNESCVLIYRAGSRGFSVEISGKLSNFNFLNDYFAGHGVDADSVIKNPRNAAEVIDGIAVSTKPPRYHIIRKARYLIVDGTTCDNPAATLDSVCPEFVIPCPNLNGEAWQLWQTESERRGVRLLNPGDSPLRVNL